MNLARPARLSLLLPLAAFVLLAGCMPDGVLITPVSTNRALTETVLYREGPWVGDKIVVIDIAGLLLNAETPGLFRSGEHPVSLLTEQLDKARRDKTVKAVVLRINSPGGGVTASEIMHDEITRFKKHTGKPVIAAFMDVAASGGYYVACAADLIFAQRSTVTGSIGVIVQLFEFSGTMTKLGIVSNAIVSGPNKAAGSPFGPLSDDQRAIFQGIVDGMYDQFVAVVAQGRPGLDEPQVRKIADGRVYTAEQALELGLIDHIGSMRDAVAAAKHAAGVEKIKVVRYHRPLEYVANYHATSPPTGPTNLNLVNVNLPTLWNLVSPRFMYLWAPGG